MKETSATRLVVSCSNCGNVKVASSDVTIRNCVDNDAWSYWFICPSCRTRAAAATRRQPALDAICAGSTLDTWRIPAEVNERPSGPPLTLVDLLALHLLLLEPDWVDQVG